RVRLPPHQGPRVELVPGLAGAEDRPLASVEVVGEPGVLILGAEVGGELERASRSEERVGRRQGVVDDDDPARDRRATGQPVAPEGARPAGGQTAPRELGTDRWGEDDLAVSGLADVGVRTRRAGT